MVTERYNRKNEEQSKGELPSHKIRRTVVPLKTKGWEFSFDRLSVSDTGRI